jgi:hypothetical protein
MAMKFLKQNKAFGASVAQVGTTDLIVFLQQTFEDHKWTENLLC